jgi:hypothetical protein
MEKVRLQEEKDRLNSDRQRLENALRERDTKVRASAPLWRISALSLY